MKRSKKSNLQVEQRSQTESGKISAPISRRAAKSDSAEKISILSSHEVTAAVSWGSVKIGVQHIFKLRFFLLSRIAIDSRNRGGKRRTVDLV